MQVEKRKKREGKKEMISELRSENDKIRGVKRSQRKTTKKGGGG